jgi:hypothetical protein
LPLINAKAAPVALVINAGIIGTLKTTDRWAD